MVLTLGNLFVVFSHFPMVVNLTVGSNKVCFHPNILSQLITASSGPITGIGVTYQVHEETPTMMVGMLPSNDIISTNYS
jgi:hypothetical protein